MHLIFFNKNKEVTTSFGRPHKKTRMHIFVVNAQYKAKKAFSRFLNSFEGKIMNILTYPFLFRFFLALITPRWKSESSIPQCIDFPPYLLNTKATKLSIAPISVLFQKTLRVH